MNKSKHAEIQYLIGRGTFRAVLKSEVADRTNMKNAGYILTIPSSEDKEERYGTIHMTGGHLNAMKNYIVHEAPTI